VHLLQIWIEPARTGLPPGYEQKTFSDADKRGRLRLIASSDGREGSVTINQDAAVYATVLAPEQRVTHALARRRRGWLQVARGTLTLNGQALAHGDGAAIEGAETLEIQGIEPVEALLFDLP
jgi:redox-sensitive bicupin YhaK (pirin superfamily)